MKLEAWSTTCRKVGMMGQRGRDVRMLAPEHSPADIVKVHALIEAHESNMD
jgi:hypothetical protein